MSGFKALVLVVFVALAGVVSAQAKVSDVERITAGERDKVAAIFAQQQRNFMETCQTVKLVKAAAVSVAEPVVLMGDKVTGGRWRVRYQVDACGKMGLRTAEFSAVPGGIAIEALAPGETLADKRLQDDVVKSFTLAGAVAMPSCGAELVVRDTKVQVYPQNGKLPWREIWIGSMCGRDVGQIVEFLPTKTGTTFKMSVPKATVK